MPMPLRYKCGETSGSVPYYSYYSSGGLPGAGGGVNGAQIALTRASPDFVIEQGFRLGREHNG